MNKGNLEGSRRKNTGVLFMTYTENRSACGVSVAPGGCATYQIPVPLIREELDGESTGIASSVRRPLFATDGGKTNEDGGLLADFGKEIRRRQIGKIIRDLEYSVSASTLGMNNTT
jgi:hypothetical protein